MADVWYLDDCAIETRLARRVRGKLAGIWHYPKLAVRRRACLGEVYLVRVGTRRPGAGGSFVDLGEAGGGFIRKHASGPAPEGSLILATVVQEAVGAKVPRLVPEVRLDGRGMAMTWNGLERKELRAKGAVAERCEAEGCEAEGCEAEGDLLRAELIEVRRLENGRAPMRVAEAPSAARRLAARVAPGDRILVAGAHMLGVVRGEIARWAPGIAAEVAPATAALFEAEGVEAEVEAALDPIVALPGGGRLIIEMTAALTAVDVDAGAGRAADANAEAAEQIPFEIAARALAGTLVVDFAQLRERSTRARLAAALQEGAARLALELDVRGGHRGLLEIRRPRAEAPLAACLTQSGLTHLAIPRTLSFDAQAARIARAIQRARPAARREVRVPLSTLAWLNNEGRAFKEAIAAAVPGHLNFAEATLRAADGFELLA